MNNLFTFVPSSDPQVEDDMWMCNANPAVYIQDCRDYGGGYFANAEVTADGGVGGFLELGEFKTLKSAMASVIAYVQSQKVAA